MGEMADYFFDCMTDETFAVMCPYAPHPDLDFWDLAYREPRPGEWIDGDGDVIEIKEMSDDHIGAAIGWCLKHFPDESKEKVAELKAEQVRREFECL